MEIITTNLKSAGVRRAIRNGREYYVCSASIINPGVLAGSKGALYYPPDECQRNARDWEGTPLVLYHPTRNGQYVSIRDDPSAIDRQGLGEFLKPRFKSKLGGEMWFDAQKVANADKYLVKNGVEPILPRLRKGIPVELSTGLFTENIPAEQGAMFNGRPYTHVARNYRPDHIAILPNQIGACILPGQEIQGRITKASKAWYTGEAIRIETLSGELLSVTPNHPILTDMGFVPASDLTEGQNLLHYVREDKATTTDTNEKYAPALAEDVFDALASLSTHEEAVRTRATTLDFHGDAGFFQGDVQIVSPQSALSSGSVPKTAKRFIQGGFGGRGNCQSSLSSRSHTQQFTRLVDATDVRQVSFGSESLTLLERQPGVHEARGGGSVSRDTALLEPGVDDALVDTQFSLNFISVFPSAVGCDNFSNKLGWEAGFGNQPLTGFCVFGPGAELNISLPKTVSNRRVMEAKLFRQLLHTFPSKITTDKIVHLDRFFHNGPVYDFESSLGYIIAQKLLVSNCSINDGCGVLVNARGGDGAAWYPVVGNEARDVRLVPVQNVWTDAARQASAEARSASKKAHEASAKIGHRTILDPSYASTGMSGPSDIHYHAAHLHMGAAAELLNEANRDDNAGYFDKANMKRDVAQMHEDAALSNFNAAREIEGSVHRPSQPKLGWQQNQRNPTANMWSEEARQAALEARRASATAGAKSREAAAYHGSFEESEMYKAGQRGQKADSVKQHLQAAEMHRIAAEKHERTADYLGSGDAGRGEHYRAAKLNMDAADAHERAAGIKSGGGMHGGGGFGAMNPQGPPKPVQAQLSRGSGVAGESLEMSREAAQRVSNQWQAIRNVWTEEARAAAAASKRAKAISDKHPEQSEESKKAGERAFSDAKYAGGKGGPYLHIQARQSHNNAAEIAEREGHPDLAAAHREAGIAHETARRQTEAVQYVHGKAVDPYVKPTSNDKKQPSEELDISSEKACQILHDKEVRGHPLTDDQRKMFGAKCSESRNQWHPVNNQSDQQSAPAQVVSGSQSALARTYLSAGSRNRHPASGKFQKGNAGSGNGPAHDAAKQGKNAGDCGWEPIQANFRSPASLFNFNPSDTASLQGDAKDTSDSTSNYRSPASLFNFSPSDTAEVSGNKGDGSVFGDDQFLDSTPGGPGSGGRDVVAKHTHNKDRSPAAMMMRLDKQADPGRTYAHDDTYGDSKTMNNFVNNYWTEEAREAAAQARRAKLGGLAKKGWSALKTAGNKIASTTKDVYEEIGGLGSDILDHGIGAILDNASAIRHAASEAAAWNANPEGGNYDKTATQRIFGTPNKPGYDGRDLCEGIHQSAHRLAGDQDDDDDIDADDHHVGQLFGWFDPRQQWQPQEVVGWADTKGGREITIEREAGGGPAKVSNCHCGGTCKRCSDVANQDDDDDYDDDCDDDERDDEGNCPDDDDNDDTYNAWSEAARRAAIEARTASQKAHDATVKIGHAAQGVSGNALKWADEAVHGHGWAQATEGAANAHMQAHDALRRTADQKAAMGDMLGARGDVRAAGLHADAASAHRRALVGVTGNVVRMTAIALNAGGCGCDCDGCKDCKGKMTGNAWTEEARAAAAEVRRAHGAVKGTKPVPGWAKGRTSKMKPGLFGADDEAEGHNEQGWKPKAPVDTRGKQGGWTEKPEAPRQQWTGQPSERKGGGGGWTAETEGPRPSWHPVKQPKVGMYNQDLAGPSVPAPPSPPPRGVISAPSKKKKNTMNREWSSKKREEHPAKDFAGPDRSFPIETQEDVDAAIRSIGRTKHDPDVVKAGIKRIAKRKGLDLPPSLAEDGDDGD